MCWTQLEPSEKESGVWPNAPWVLACGMRVLVLTGPPMKACTVMLWLFSSGFSSDDSCFGCGCPSVDLLLMCMYQQAKAIPVQPSPGHFLKFAPPSILPTALCLVSEDCSWPSPPGIEAVSFNSLSHFVQFSRETSFQMHTGLCNEALMFSRNGNSENSLHTLWERCKGC